MNFKATIFTLMTLPVFSQSVINQQQTSYIGSNAYLLAFDQPGQSFTVSISSKITKIEVIFIIDIQRYLNLGEHDTIEKTFENDIPQDFINNANAYEELQ